MAFRSDMGRGAAGGSDRACRQAFGENLRGVFPDRKSGFPCRWWGRKSADADLASETLQASRTGDVATLPCPDIEPEGGTRAIRTKLERKNSPAFASSSAMRLACRTAAS